MKIKIIKRTAQAKVQEKMPPVENDRSAKTEGRKLTATVKFWIDDLREKRERERLSFQDLFKKEQCT